MPFLTLGHVNTEHTLETKRNKDNNGNGNNNKYKLSHMRKHLKSIKGY